MPEYCTCGAQLPPDARFCHKCGKPQREEDVPAVEAIEQPVTPFVAPPELPPAIAPISFHNRTAVSTAVISAFLSFLFTLVLGPVAFLAWAAGGLFAVYLYQRRTGISLTPGAGARLGWLSGIFLFVIVLVTFTIQLAILTPAGWMEQTKKLIMETYPDRSTEMMESIAFLFTPGGIIAAMVILFLFATAMATLAGSLGAKLMARR